MMWSELSFSAFRKNSAVIGGTAGGAIALPAAMGVLTGAEVSISTWSVMSVGLAGGPPPGPPSAGQLGCKVAVLLPAVGPSSMEVSFDWVSVGWGVRFMMPTDCFPPFRAGDAERSCTAAVGGPLLLCCSNLFGEVMDAGSVTMHLSEVESSGSSTKTAGLGEGLQPGGWCTPVSGQNSSNPRCGQDRSLGDSEPQSGFDQQQEAGRRKQARPGSGARVSG